jgi:DNA-binding NarL/FixJ family response regulator
LQLGASSYLSKHRATEELTLAVRRVLAGKPYVTTALAGMMVENLGRPSQIEPHQTLSNRELQVLRMIAEGHSQKEIAAKLGLSVKTVSTYRARLAEKMHARSNVELTRYAMNHNLVK